MQNSPARAPIDVGSVIAGTYTIEALIGRGGMGAVFLASHARLPGKKVAIKVLHAEMNGDEVLARFKREAQIASMLSHPNIVHIEDYNVTDDGMPYLVLEYLQGESLAQRIKRGPLPVDQALSIIRQVGSALAAAHGKGIVHRDLKPQNIFLVPSELDGRSIEIAKVLDFGISKMRDSQTVKTQDSALLGTPQYMAPEQATGQHANVDERTDVFALGAIVYEMLSGAPAFSGASIPEVVFKVVYEQPTALSTQVPSLPARIAAAVHRAMSKASTERFSSVSDFIEGLTGQPLPPPRATTPIPSTDGPSTGPRTPNTNREAFAQTMGSGEHGPPVGTATPPPPDPLVRGSAPTVDSQVAGPVPKAPEPARSSKHTGWIVAGAMAVVAVIAIGVAFRSGKHAKKRPPVAQVDTPPHEDPPLLAAAAPPVPATPDAAIPVVETGSAGRAEAPKPTDKKRTDAKPPVTPKAGDKSPAKAGEDDSAGDATAAQKLRDADDALHASQWSRAEQLANAVINNEDAWPKQKARASMIHGMVQCLGRNNEEIALTDLRRITSAPVFRRRLLSTCQKAGFLNAER
ncbi:MAG TPA: protein kinase [Kofleriaceae bacterium]|nr:protein kinase [Kofleriaceae bacterium]